MLNVFNERNGKRRPVHTRLHPATVPEHDGGPGSYRCDLRRGQTVLAACLASFRSAGPSGVWMHAGPLRSRAGRSLGTVILLLMFSASRSTQMGSEHIGRANYLARAKGVCVSASRLNALRMAGTSTGS